MFTLTYKIDADTEVQQDIADDEALYEMGEKTVFGNFSSWKHFNKAGKYTGGASGMNAIADMIEYAEMIAAVAERRALIAA